MSTTLGSRAAGRDDGNRASSPPAVRPVRAATGQVEHALDDTTPAIFSRIGPRVSAGELMFQRNTPVHFTRPMAEMLRTKCPVDQMSSGTAECATLFPAGAPRDQALYDACLFDYCFGEVEHALQVAKTLATTEELKDAGLIT